MKILEKMDEFFEKHLDGYDEHMLGNIELPMPKKKKKASELPQKLF